MLSANLVADADLAGSTPVTADLTLTVTNVNLVLTSIEMVDGKGQPIATPVIGQKVFYRARWTASGFTDPVEYVVRYTIDGISVESPVLTFGNGNFSWYRGITYASPGSHHVSIVVDGGGAIAETSEEDNTLTTSFTPIPPSDLPQKFVYPVVGEPHRDYRAQYADVDPRVGFREDYRGGPFQYDGHDAIDTGPPLFSDQDRGVAIIAAAAGTVIEVSDGFYDRETTMGSRPSNFVKIDHGNGWETHYWHFAANSIVVKVGDTVTQGQLLGLMGSSGSSTFVHLHWYVGYRGAPVETLYAPSEYWIAPPTYQGDVPSTVMRSGISSYDIGPELSEGPSNVTVFPTSQNVNPTYWYKLSSSSADAKMEISWIRPDGAVQTTYERTLGDWGPSWWMWIFSGWKSAFGTWHAAVSVDGVEIDRQPFTVVADEGEPEAAVYHGTNLIVDRRVTPIDFGVIPVGGTAVEQTFTIANRGFSVLTTAIPDLPSGFSLVGDAPSSVAADGSASFTVRLDSTVVGRKMGQIRIITNDSDEPEYTFLVGGEVTGTTPAGRPSLTLPGPAVPSLVGSGPMTIDADADVHDPDAVTWRDATLRAEVFANGTDRDRLFVRHQGMGTGQVGVVDESITYGGVSVASFTGGAGRIPLHVTFTEDATLPAVRAVLRGLVYTRTQPDGDTRPRFLGLTFTDADGFTSEQAVKRVSSAPGLATTIVLATDVIDENNPLGATVGTFNSPVADTTDVFTHQLVDNDGSTDNSLFLIEGNILKAATAFDFETGDRYSIRVRSTDQHGRMTEQVFAVTVSDSNEPPTGVSLSNTTTTIAEHTSTASRIKLADIAITDDALGINAITLTGADAGSFEVDGLELFLKAGVPLDFEAKPSYAVTVSVADAALAGSTPVTVDFTLTVTNVNEPPTGVSLSNTTTTIAENASTASRIKLADIVITDDALGTNALSLSGRDEASFEISNQGSLYLKAGVSLDYATKPTLSVTVSARDNSIVGSSPVSVGYSLDVIPRSPHLTTGANGQLFIDGQPVTYANSLVTSSFQSWTIFEAAVIRGQNLFFAQHSTGVIHRLYANADWSLVGGLYGVGSAYSIYLPRSARGPNVPFIPEPEPLPADLLTPLEISGTQLRIDPIGQLYANETMLTRQGSSAGVKLRDLAGYSPIAIMRTNPDSTWRNTLLWQHRIDQSLVEWQFNSGWGYQGNSRVPVESTAALELAYQVDINRDGHVGLLP